MTKAKRMLSLLLAVIMILSVIPITASAAENDGTTGGIKTHKEYNEETGYLTLEAYVTGESQTQIVAQPVDIALVLDVSGSMESLSEATLYYWAYRSDDSFIKVSDKGNLGELDTVYGAEEGIYMLKSTGLSDSYAPMRYINGTWQYEGLKATWDVLWNPQPEWKDVEKSNWGSGNIYITKLNALKIAVKRFIDSAAAASDPTNPNRISIIKFAGTKTNAVGNDTYKEGGFTYNYSQIVQNLTDVNANKEALKDVIGTSAKAASDTNPRGLTPGGATQADFGMQHAQTVLANTDSSRKKVAIMFTDGEPTSGNSFETAVANGAITTAKALKDSGTTIFTVGCFSSTPSTNTTNYMNYVSSNYPNATSLTRCGTAVEDAKYYSTATTSADLTSIFQTISQEIGGASVTLTETTVLKDTVSKYFDLDTDGVDAKAIKVHTETCTAIDADGNPTAWSNDNNEGQYQYVLDGKTITVTGFDYSANWVGSHNGRPGGKKIVLRIPIKPIDEKCWGLDLPTNDAGNSGIYVDNKPVAPFSVPTVNFPYYEIVHVKQNADGTLSYTGDTEETLGKTVVPTETLANRVRIENASATVDLTTKVPNRYLYGGSFSNKECTEAQTYANGESPASFHPQSGATYYIWEAPVDYLVPKSLSLSKTIDGQPNVIGFYLLTGVDRLFYQSAGFDVTDGSGNSISITDVGESGSTALNGGSGKVYQSLTTVYTNGTSDTYRPGDGVFKPLSASSYLACFSVPESAWAAKDKKVVFTPYWITLDGMKVTGTTTRTCQSDGPGSRVVKMIAEAKSGSTIMPANTAVQMLLTACGNVAVDGSENAPSASVDPIDPIGPVVPIDPIDPVTPVDPVEPAKQFSVTVYDGGSVYTLSAEAGEDISSRLVSAGMHGMRFAGWFLDERSTAAAELKNVQGDMDVYAKYVSDTYLTLRYRNVGLFRSRNVKLYAALDSTDYAEAGFVIDGKAVSCPITKDAYTAFFLYGSTVREDNTLVSYTYGTSDLRYGDTVEITPYWVTLDGTTVYGTTQTLTYGRFGLM